MAYKQRGGNPLLQILQLILGVLSSVLSILWLVHVIAYVFVYPPSTTFLNGYFVALDSVFPLFGTVTYAIFSAYLLCCVVKGNIKFGARHARAGAAERGAVAGPTGAALTRPPARACAPPSAVQACASSSSRSTRCGSALR